jgi:hypothetical protein
VVPVARARLLATLLAGCDAVCDDCFSIEIGQYDGTWTDCCRYDRQAQADVVLVRITRLAGDTYRAGLGAACTWESAESETPVAYQAPLVTLDAAQVDSTATFNVDFTAEHDQAVLGIDCQPARPEPQYPDVLLYLKDPDLGAQFDPEGYAEDAAVLRIEPVIVP